MSPHGLPGASRQRPGSRRGAITSPPAALAADALIDAGLLSREQFDQAAATVSEEVFVRLCLLDYPPAAATNTSE
jgi:hypothetical protein